LPRRIPVLCLLAWLSACVAPPAATVCRTELKAELPAHLNHGHIVVPGAIDGQPVQFVVDTAAGTMLDEAARQLLHVPTDPDRHTVLYGLGAGYLRSRRIWLSHATRQMFVAPQPRLSVQAGS
jgi:hypothetical protein